MRCWFVSFSYQKNIDTPTKFSNTVMSDAYEYFDFMTVEQKIAEHQECFKVTILNWKEIHILEYRAAKEFVRRREEERLVSN